MTKQEAIKLLIPLRNSMVDQYGCPISDVVFALDVAIDVLDEKYPCSLCKYYDDDGFAMCMYCPSEPRKERIQNDTRQTHGHSEDT